MVSILTTINTTTKCRYILTVDMLYTNKETMEGRGLNATVRNRAVCSVCSAVLNVFVPCDEYEPFAARHKANRKTSNEMMKHYDKYHNS